MREELLKGLTEEQIAKLKECKGQEEILAAAKEEGIELTEEQLAAVSGGHCYDGSRCPHCKQNTLKSIGTYTEDGKNWVRMRCTNCGYVVSYDEV